MIIIFLHKRRRRIKCHCSSDSVSDVCYSRGDDSRTRWNAQAMGKLAGEVTSSIINSVCEGRVKEKQDQHTGNNCHRSQKMSSSFIFSNMSWNQPKHCLWIISRAKDKQKWKFGEVKRRLNFHTLLLSSMFVWYLYMCSPSTASLNIARRDNFSTFLTQWRHSIHYFWPKPTNTSPFFLLFASYLQANLAIKSTAEVFLHDNMRTNEMPSKEFKLQSRKRRRIIFFIVLLLFLSFLTQTDKNFAETVKCKTLNQAGAMERRGQRDERTKRERKRRRDLEELFNCFPMMLWGGLKAQSVGAESCWRAHRPGNWAWPF